MDAVWAYGHALCCNALAARYALWAACVLAPLYAFVLRPAACARTHADDDEAAIAAAATSDAATRRAPPLATRDASHSATMTTTTVTTATHHESLMLESRVQHALARCYSLRACDACNVTPRALEELYASPAFARWYAARRAGLLAQVAQRRRYRRWTSVAALALLLVGVCALPAYSFDDVPRLDLVPRASYDTHNDNSNNNDNSSSSRSLPSVSSRAVRASTLAQLLVQRAADVRVRADKAASSSSSSSSSLLLVLRSLVPHVRAEAEVMLIVTTLCTLLTTPFMPPRSTHAATVALLCLCVVLAESVAVATAQLRLGFGFLVVFGVVAWRVVRLPST